jgi:hypothetical protein
MMTYNGNDGNEFESFLASEISSLGSRDFQDGFIGDAEQFFAGLCPNSCDPNPYKRKCEILSVLRVYADELQKKRLKTMIMEEHVDVDPIELENQRKRLEIFDPIMDAFNTGDFQLMSDLMREHCREDVELSASSLRGNLRGIVPLLVFFGLLHETFPDAMVKILERRLCSTKKPVGKFKSDLSLLDCDVVQSVDYVYKLVGTSISIRPIHKVFNKVMEGLKSTNEEITQDDITCAISGLLNTDTSATENECSFIVETELAFDRNNKIIKWSYVVLAADVR